MHPSHRPLSGRLRRVAVAAAALLTTACMGGPEHSGVPAPMTFPSPHGRRPESYTAPGASLAIPVRGIRADQLTDTYEASRSGGRVHNAIDIMAARGTPVLAAEDGTILKLRTGGLGGITVYQLAPDGRTMFYYAHLQRYAAGLREGLPVWKGQVIAYVGDTGNAGAGNYHLHFSVSHLADPRRWWESDNVNPYPMLAGSAARSRPARAAKD